MKIPTRGYHDGFLNVPLFLLLYVDCSYVRGHGTDFSP
jgi:hypothetical protein